MWEAMKRERISMAQLPICINVLFPKKEGNKDAHFRDSATGERREDKCFWTGWDSPKDGILQWMPPPALQIDSAIPQSPIHIALCDVHPNHPGTWHALSSNLVLTLGTRGPCDFPCDMPYADIKPFILGYDFKRTTKTNKSYSYIFIIYIHMCVYKICVLCNIYV